MLRFSFCLCLCLIRDHICLMIGQVLICTSSTAAQTRHFKTSGLVEHVCNCLQKMLLANIQYIVSQKQYICCFVITLLCGGSVVNSESQKCIQACSTYGIVE